MKQKWLLAFSLLSLTCASKLSANPQGFSLVSGSASFSNPSSNTAQITQTSSTAIIQWSNFSIGVGETTQFVQPSSTASVLNRVTTGSPSQLLGTLTGNGKIYLVNPNGILVGQNAYINAGSFIGSTLDVLNSAFLAGGDMTFSGSSTASIVNLGRIDASNNDIFLLAYYVTNTGTLHAPNGVAGCGAGANIILKSAGSQRIYVQPQTSATRSTTDTGIEHTGTIEAVQAELQADGNLYKFAIKDLGIIEAKGLISQEGRVYLAAVGGSLSTTDTIGGIVEVSESIKATSSEDRGGVVHILGNTVVLNELATITTSNNAGGGTVLIGGDYHGDNPDIANTQAVYLHPQASIHADALASGDGGKIILWGDLYNGFFGSITACGGPSGGNGGFIEISSPRMLFANGLVNTLAPQGSTGTVLFDPTDVTISVAVDNNAAFAPPNYIFTAGTANINTTTLQNNLNTSNVIINTSSPYGGIGSITVVDGFGWTTPHSLSLIANDSPNSFITLQQFVNSTSGAFGIGQTAVYLQSKTINIGRAIDNVHTGIMTQTGDIRVTCDTLNIVGGTAPGGSNRGLITGGLFNFLPLGIGPVPPASGDIYLSIAQDCNLLAGVFTNTNAQILAVDNIFATIGRDLTLSTPTPAAGSLGGARTTVQTYRNNISLAVGRNCTLTAGPQANDFASIVAANDLNCTVGNNVQLQGGSGSLLTSYATMTAINGSQTTNIGGSLVLIGGGGIGSGHTASITAGNNLNLNVIGRITANGGDASSPASISATNGSANVTSGDTISLTAGGSSASITTSMKDLTVTSGSAININEASFIRAETGNMNGTYPLLVIAGTNIAISNTGQIANMGAGDLTLVVDNRFPTFPEFGTGGLFLSYGSSIEAVGGGKVRLFTSARAFNVIPNGIIINGAVYHPGTEGVDTAQERWGVYYPDPFFGGPGFTLFYKTPTLLTPDIFLNRTDFLASELFYRLSAFEWYLPWNIYFSIAFAEEKDKMCQIFGELYYSLKFNERKWIHDLQR